jgi:hypothetical protein
MEHSYFNLMLYLFQEDCKQPEGYKVGLLNIHMIQDKTIQLAFPIDTTILYKSPQYDPIHNLVINFEVVSEKKCLYVFSTGSFI